MFRSLWCVLAVCLVSLAVPADLMSRALCQQLKVAGTKDMLKIHEEPEKYVGKTIIVSSELGWLNPVSLNYRKSVNGYLFYFNFGPTLKESRRFGNHLILISDQMNYVVMPTELGRDIIANWKTTGLTNYRVMMTFKIVKMRINDIIEEGLLHSRRPIHCEMMSLE